MTNRTQIASELEFANIGEAVDFASALNLRKICSLPMTFAGVTIGDDGEKLPTIMRRSGELTFTLYEG